MIVNRIIGTPWDLPVNEASLPDQKLQPVLLVLAEDRDRLGGTLPAPLTNFVGREREVQAVGELLRQPKVRLVTLTGPGGVGKTRLALRLAEDLAKDFPDGIALVPLTSIRESAFVLSTIAQTLAIRETGERPLHEVLETFLRRRRLLLILDNFEQVVGAAPSVSALLTVCPGLKMLVTSQIALRVIGEQEFAVPPLDVPDLERLPPVAELERTGAVALFAQRARAVRPDFVLADETAPTVVQICRQLDGLPLAIELAAARIKVLSLPALASRLTNRLQVLTSGPQDLPVRLQTMRAAIDWSYDLLTVEERALFRRLAVFVGGFTLEAAEFVGSGDEASSTPSLASGVPTVFDGIASLVDKSLLTNVTGVDGELRFVLLETIREYGRERLAEAGEEEATRHRHAAWFTALAEELWPALQHRIGAAQAINRLASDHDNLQAALFWFEQTGEGEALERLSGALFLFWYVRGHLREGRSWIERALMLGSQTPVPVRARALLGAGMLAHYATDDARAVPWIEESLALYRSSADRWGQAFALTMLGIVAEDAGDYDLAGVRFTEGLVHARAADDPVETGLALFHLGIIAWGQGERDRASQLLNEALTCQRAAGDLVYGAAESLAFLGLFTCEQGDHRRAAELQQESLSLHLQLGSQEVLAVNLANVAMLAQATQRPMTAARLFGSAIRQREEIENPFKLPERAVYERAIVATRVGLRDDEFATAWEIGRAHSLAEAATDALTVLDEIASQTPTSQAAATARGVVASLTGREREVLRLLIDGRSDREIGEALFISPRTAQAHVANIFTKLNVSTRAAAVATALQSGLFDE